MARYTACIILILLSCVVYAQEGEWYLITDFSGGIQPRVSPSQLPPNAAIRMDDINVEGGKMEKRDGFAVWPMTYPDSMSTGHRGMFEFYNVVTTETQVLAINNSEMLYKADTTSHFRYLGISGIVEVVSGDTVVYGQSASFVQGVMPSNGEGWRLYIGLDDSLSAPIKRIVGNQIVLDDTTFGFSRTTRCTVAPPFSTSNNVGFTTWGQNCYISDGINPVRIWSNNSLLTDYYIVDSATIDSLAWLSGDGSPQGEPRRYVIFSTALTLGTVDSVGDYYANSYIFIGQDTSTATLVTGYIAYATSLSTKRLFVNLDSIETVTSGTMGYIALPISTGYSFNVDTVFTGTLDSTSQRPGYGNGYRIVAFDTDQTWEWRDFRSGVYKFFVTDGMGAVKYVDGEHFFMDWVTDGAANELALFIKEWSNHTHDSLDNTSEYQILRYDYYPRVKFTTLSSNRLWLASTPEYPNRMWYSEVNDPNDISTVNFEEVGGDDGDELMGFSARQNYRIGYKRNHIYQITGDFSSSERTSILSKSQNYGLWSDGMLLPYQSGDIGLNRSGLFSFNGSSVKELSQSMLPFFMDSLNLAQVSKVRGAIVGNKLLFSYPSGSETENSATLVMTLDQPTVWTTWSFAPSAYLTRRSPGQNDSLLVAPTDTSLIYIYGGSVDVSDSIQFDYQSPFMDFGMPLMQKCIEEFYLSCAMASQDSIIFEIYEDTLAAVAWADTLVNLAVGETEWRTYIRAVPASVDNAYRFSFRIRSVGFATTIKLDRFGVRVKPTQKGTVPQG